MRILLAEDEKDMADVLIAIMKHQGFDVDWAENGAVAVDLASRTNYDCMVFDIMMPVKDGITALKEVRAAGDVTPVIMLTAKSEVDDRITGLDAGADDYLTKPFSVEELLARLRVTLRRLAYMIDVVETQQSVFTNGDLTIDYAAGCVFHGGEEIHLTPMEYKLITLLSKNVGKVLTYTFITKTIWGSAWDNDIASLRVFMATLRKKIEPNPADPTYIQTHIGVGYRMMKI